MVVLKIQFLQLAVIRDLDFTFWQESVVAKTYFDFAVATEMLTCWCWSTVYYLFKPIYIFFTLGGSLKESHATQNQEFIISPSPISF